ncbi:carbamoylphosphate synthase large subunit [Xylaria longipes]|nr:carbamoylphosphate synthase large subunit [Xylaria longipes]
MATRNDTARCFALVFLSLFISPISLVVVCFFTLKHTVTSRFGSPQHTVQNGTQRIILVTGVGMAKGLTLARAFHLSGHRVIGADFEDGMIPCSGRFSKSLSGFYRLPRPYSPTRTKAYTDLLVKIITDEKVDLWVSCSGVASAIEDAQAKETIEERTSCRCIQFDVATTSMLHEKNTFMRACAERELPIPDTHEVTSRDEVLRVLSSSALRYPGRKYILKPVGMDDVNRGDMTLLPLSSHLMTWEHVSRLFISTSTPWILQQFIPGGEEYCTHSLVVRGKLKCFVACPSAELLMHYAPLPRDDALWREMRDFAVGFLERSPSVSGMTGHLSLDFMVDSGHAREKGEGPGRIVYAIECNPRAHTAVVLFAQQGLEMRDMVEAYLTAIDRPDNESINTKAVHDQKSTYRETLVTPPVALQPRYWIGHDLVSLIFQPLLRLGVGSIGCREFLNSSFIFLRHLVTWKEGSFETWDPLPALILYHVYWPLTILSAWWQRRRWSRVNVSTTKMFTC